MLHSFVLSSRRAIDEWGSNAFERVASATREAARRGDAAFI